MRYVFDSYILNRTVNVTGVVGGFVGLTQSNSNSIQTQNNHLWTLAFKFKINFF
jgi:hypothetical protein